MNSWFSRTSRGQEGQVLALVALLLATLIGMAALAIDVGFIMHAQRELQASADAAATAGALDLSSGLVAASAVSTANLYSGISGGKNASADLPGVTMVSSYPLAKCLTSIGLCSTCPCANTSGDNALAVQEQVTVSTHFAKFFGFNSIKLTAQALSSMRGATGIPYNIMVIVDTTASMQNSDSSCAGASYSGISSPSKLDCAKYGLRTLLGALWPCNPNQSSCAGQTPVQEVGLLIFPGLSSSTYNQYEYDCQAKALSSSYGLAMYSSTTNYSILGLSNDYKTSDGASSLNAGNSSLVNAVSWTNQTGCSTSKYGLQDPGGEGTYYAGAITAAQAAFSGGRAGVQNAIILLSDGDANSSSSSGQISSSLANNQCGQAVTAAQTAAGAGTWVYAIGYGVSSSGCSTDHGTYNPCSALKNIASSPGSIPDLTKFYSDSVSAANGCSSPDHSSTTTLGGIFGTIALDFMTTRLLPWNTL